MTNTSVLEFRETERLRVRMELVRDLYFGWLTTTYPPKNIDCAGFVDKALKKFDDEFPSLEKK